MRTLKSVKEELKIWNKEIFRDLKGSRKMKLKGGYGE